MTNVFFISDTHFSHNKEFIYVSRGFSSIEEHDETLVKLWNLTVRKRDIVYHLGDVTFGNFEILARLNGAIKVVLGNHDNYNKLSPYVDRCYGALQRSSWILTHIPVHPMQLSKRFTHNLHGHLHTKTLENFQYINLSADQISCTPISLEEVRSKLNEDIRFTSG